MKYLEFEWDLNKDRTNTKKHGVSFEEARTAFLMKMLFNFSTQIIQKQKTVFYFSVQVIASIRLLCVIALGKMKRLLESYQLE